MPKYRITLGKEGYGSEPLSVDDIEVEVLTGGEWKLLRYVSFLELIADADEPDKASFKMTQLSAASIEKIFGKRDSHDQH